MNVEVDARRRRVVRERDDDDPRPRPRLLPRLEQVVEEVLLGPEAHVAHLGAGEDRAPDVDRVRRARHQRGVAGAEQHPHQVREALLGADRRAGLRLGVELDAEPAPVEVGDREPQLRDAPARRVAVVARVARRLAQLVDRDRRRRHVGVAEPEVDHVLAGSPGVHLQRVDLAKTYGGRALMRRNSIESTVPARRRGAVLHPTRRLPPDSERSGRRCDRVVDDVDAVLLDLGGVLYLPDHELIT